MSNLDLYNRVRKAPDNALKPIQAGRLKGKSDINPMWRIEKLTEEFGPCGIGWRPEIVRFWLDTGEGGQIAAFCQINLYIKLGEEWSAPIPGIGGSMFVAKENSGPHTSDECYKMAYTDAISVSCKLLGFAGDVYWAAGGDSKYAPHPNQPKSKPAPAPQPMTPERWQSFWDSAGAAGWTQEEVIELAGGPINDWNAQQMAGLWNKMQAARKEAKHAQ